MNLEAPKDWAGWKSRPLSPASTRGSAVRTQPKTYPAVEAPISLCQPDCCSSPSATGALYFTYQDRPRSSVAHCNESTDDCARVAAGRFGACPPLQCLLSHKVLVLEVHTGTSCQLQRPTTVRALPARLRNCAQGSFARTSFLRHCALCLLLQDCTSPPWRRPCLTAWRWATAPSCGSTVRRR